MQQIEFRAMGCRMLATLDADSYSARRQLDLVPHWFEEWEQHLSRFRPDSELNRLNEQPDQDVRVSSILWDVMQLALRAAEWSEGLVSPTVLEALEIAGYDRTFESITSAGTLTRSVAALPDGQWRAIERHTGTRSIRLPIGVRIDFGGVAKGWAADRAARRLGNHAPALVDAGGDIALSAPRLYGQPWPIGVIDPLKPDQQIELLLVPEGGVATSGRDYRRWQRNGQWQHHIIDPRSGLPAQTDVMSVTVIGPTTHAAEVAAKVVLILGSDEGLSWLEEQPYLAGLLVLENGQILYSTRMPEYLWR
jgi:thiamine biosynthesis lipoprotein